MKCASCTDRVQWSHQPQKRASSLTKSPSASLWLPHWVCVMAWLWESRDLAARLESTLRLITNIISFSWLVLFPLQCRPRPDSCVQRTGSKGMDGLVWYRMIDSRAVIYWICARLRLHIHRKKVFRTSRRADGVTCCSSYYLFNNFHQLSTHLIIVITAQQASVGDTVSAFGWHSARSVREGIGTLTESPWEHQGCITMLWLWQTTLITCEWN